MAQHFQFGCDSQNLFPCVKFAAANHHSDMSCHFSPVQPPLPYPFLRGGFTCAIAPTLLAPSRKRCYALCILGTGLRGLVPILTLVAELFKLFQGFLLLLPCIAGLEQALGEHRLHCCLGPEQALLVLAALVSGPEQAELHSRCSGLVLALAEHPCGDRAWHFNSIALGAWTSSPTLT